MPANRVPNIDVPPIDPKTGKWNVIVWRYLASLAAQFSGVDPPVMPVNVPGVLSIVKAQAREPQLSEAAVQQAVLRILGALRARGTAGGDAADLAAIALARTAPHAARQNDDLALVALARIRMTPPPAIPVGESVTITLAKITLAGTDGSVTFVDGIQTGHVDPT